MFIQRLSIIIFIIILISGCINEFEDLKKPVKQEEGESRKPVTEKKAESNYGTIFPENASLELLFDKGIFLAGIAQGPDNNIYFCDMTITFLSGMQAGHIWKYNPVSDEFTIFRSPSGMANGIQFDSLGRMVVAEGADYGGRRIVRTDMATGMSSIIAALYKGKPFNSPNDLVIDNKGRIYFTDPRYIGYEKIEQPVQGVYRIDTDNSVHLIISDIIKPNGICLSPDQKTMYIVCYDNGTYDFGKIPATDDNRGEMKLFAYNLLDDGSVSFKNVLVDFAPDDGADTLVCDSEGNLYVTVRNKNRPGIYVYSSTGKEIAYLCTPIPSCVAFSGNISDGNQYLYITVKDKLYRIKTLKKGA